MRIESRLEQLRKAESEYDLCDSSTDGKDGKGSDQTDKEQLPAE